MRRLWILLITVFALVAVVAPATAGVTYNERSSEVVAEGGWAFGEWGDESISYGMVAARQQAGSQVGEMYFSESVGTRVTCMNGTPDDPDDDYLGYEWLESYGWGPATVTIRQNYANASANGFADVWTYSWTECWDDEMVVEPENGGEPATRLDITFTMVAEGQRITETGNYSFHIPGDYNEHTRNRSVYRSATGTAMVDGGEHQMEWGQIGRYTWSTHMNAR